MTVQSRLAFFSVVLFVFTAFGCGPSQRTPDPKPLPAGTTFTGVWYSPQYEHMYLRQTGDDVHGIFTHEEGGTLEGKVTGNLMKFVWVEPGDKTEARRGFEGKGYLQMVKEGEKLRLVGEWGYKDKAHGGGPWEAEWVRDLEPDDPRSLQEWKEEND